MQEYINEIKDEYQKGIDYFNNSKDIKFDNNKVKEAVIIHIAKEYALTCNQVKEMVES